VLLNNNTTLFNNIKKILIKLLFKPECVIILLQIKINKRNFSMSKENKNINSLEMQSLILEALYTKNEDDTPRKQTFAMHDYKGCISDLFSIVECLAIKNNLIDKVAEIPLNVWGTPGVRLTYRRNTSFNENELTLSNEEIRLFMFQNVISPGAFGRGYGDDWPYFHVTQYGQECLAKRDILPYDPEKYMKRLQAISSFDEWESFYVEQSLKCFNFGAMESSIIMLGLAGEYLAT